MKITFLSLFALLVFFIKVNAQEVEVIEIVDDNETVFEAETTVDNSYFVYKNKKYKKSKINDSYSYFYDEKAGYYDKKYGLLKNEKVVFPPVFKTHDTPSNRVVMSLNNIYGLYNFTKGDWDIPLKFNGLDQLKNDFFKVKLNGLYGIVDGKGDIIVNFIWSSIESMYYIDNYYKVQDKDNANYYGLLSIYDRKLALPCVYNSIENDGTSSYFKVKKNNKYNLVDINNNPIFTKWYEELVLPRGGRKHYIVKLDGRMGIIDRNEVPVVPLEYINIESSAFSDGSFLAQNREGKFGCISLDGRITMPFKYSNIEKVGYGSTNIIARTNDKCGIVRVNDGMPYEIATCDYDDIESKDKIFIVEKDNKYGMLDQYGNIITEIVYDYIQSISKSSGYGSSSKLYIAQQGDKYFFINSNGEKINSTYYNLIKPLLTLDNYGRYYASESYIVVQGNNKKYGLIDVFGKEVIAQQYDDILSMKDNYVVVKNKGKVGLHNLIKNSLIIPIEYDQFFLDKDDFIVKKANDFFQIIISDKVKLLKL